MTIPRAAARAQARPRGTAPAWAERAAELAAWVDAHVVNRRDAYGQYIAPEARTDPRLTAFTAKGEPTLEVIARHFRGASQGHLIGLHSTVRDEPRGEGETAACWSRWTALDIDRHDDATDPEATQAAALAWFAKATRLGLLPILTDSNGRGGFHLLLCFEGPIPTAKAMALGQWLCRDWADFGLRPGPESFPKQPTIEPGRFGNWLRLPGRHHTHDHWSKVWDGRSWLEGAEAVAYILATRGASLARVPTEALTPPAAPAPPRKKVKVDPKSDAALAASALPFVKHMANDYQPWLEIGMALTPLGADGLDLWDAWSRDYCLDKWQEGACERRWRSFRRSGLTLGTLFHHAKNNGWQSPGRNGSHNGNGRHHPKAEANGRNHAPPPTDEAPPAEAEDNVPPNKAADDPFRLAKVIIGGRYHHRERPTLITWNDEQFEYRDGAYRSTPKGDMRSKISGDIEREFVRLNVEALKRHAKAMAELPDDAKPSDRKPPPKAMKVHGRLVADVHQAVASLTLLDSRVRSPAWLDEAGPHPASELVSVRNGLLHIPSLLAGQPCLLPPTPRFLSTWALPFDFDDEAPEPALFLRFLRQIWEGDEESIQALQEIFGYCLMGDTGLQKIFAWIGPKRSGKGTLARVLSALLGEGNTVSPGLATLGSNFGLAPLIGKPLAIVSDARLSGRSDQASIVENILRISGEDDVSIDRKYQAVWTGRLPTRFVLIANELPRLMDSSGALAGRLILLKMTRSFYGCEDRGLTGKLLTELPGVLLWAVEGWRRLQARGRFLQPESGRELVDEMEELGSPIGVFLRECCNRGPEQQATAERLFKGWSHWCNEAGRKHSGSIHEFARQLRSAMPELKNRPPANARQEDGTRKRTYFGLDLRPEFAAAVATGPRTTSGSPTTFGDSGGPY